MKLFKKSSAQSIKILTRFITLKAKKLGRSLILTLFTTFRLKMHSVEKFRKTKRCLSRETLTCLASDYLFYKFPLSCCSNSMDSKSALKLPAPKPLWLRLWMISMKTVGRSWRGLLKIWSK